MMTWKWNREAREVLFNPDAEGRIAPEDYPAGWAEPSPAEVRAFDITLRKAEAVYVTLGQAHQAYAGGKASYENASTELRFLIDEANKSAQELIAACTEIDRFFGERVSLRFEGKGNEFHRFCNEWLAEVQHPEALRKNSSRAPGENSLAERPPTVRTANGSSATRTEASSESDLSR